MTLQEAVYARHSVREYEQKSLPSEIRAALQAKIDELNQASGLHIQLVCDEEQAFSGSLAHYGSFRNVSSYLILAGPDSKTLDETCGFYGEELVLYAQTLGLNTCWVALTYSKSKAVYTLDVGEKLCIVISLGYGRTQGVPHRSKSMEKVVKAGSNTPDWFRRGMEFALLAPTAINQQQFRFDCRGTQVSAKALLGPCSKIDLGIVKYHFELGAGKENFTWK